MAMNARETIFLIGNDGQLERVSQDDYDSEDRLQTLIENHPDLLAGEQMQPENPPRWLCVKREAGIPGCGEAGDRWSVDHLFLDQHGTPTFIEVKRSTDTRIRREVVGQMLDYAANAQIYWPRDRIRSLAAEGCGGEEKLAEEILRLLDWDGDDPSAAVEAFWNEVESKLRAGEVRLLFVADELPRELKRIIEFLNEQMPSVTVLGVEVRQYTGKDLRALVPRVVGQTELARQGKRTGGQSPKRINRTDFLAACTPAVRKLFEHLLDEAAAKRIEVAWQSRSFTMRAALPSGTKAAVMYGYHTDPSKPHSGSLDFYLKHLDEETAVSVRKKLLAACSFEDRGKHTLHLPLDDSDLAPAFQALDVIWNTIAELQDPSLAEV